MTFRENVLKSVRFETPDYIPMTFELNDACWDYYEQEFLFELMESHPLLFPDFKHPKGKYVPAYLPNARKDIPFIDDWGCTWQTSTDGITGTVTKHPLESWQLFSDYQSPNPHHCMGTGPIDWQEENHRIQNLKHNEKLAKAGLRHGHTFLQLCDIRGYENLIFDMVDEEPGLPRLIQMVEDFNLEIVKHYLAMDIDMMIYAEDLGMQNGPMLSPAQFQKYIRPSYERLMHPAKEKEVLIHMHSDGDIRTLSDSLMISGVDVLNLQDLVNGIDWIKENLKNRVCIELDIDRQQITASGTPKEIDSLIREEVMKLGSAKGGLMMIYGLYPGVPAENIKALMNAMEKYSLYYS